MGGTELTLQACAQEAEITYRQHLKDEQRAGGTVSCRVRGLVREFLFLILPFSETATDPTTTKSTRTLESKPTGTL